MAFSPAALLDRFRRDKVKDPFGGDDLFDGESRFAGKGPKIALIASGVLFLLLIGGIGAIVATGDKSAGGPPVAGSLADLEVAEDTDTPAAAPSVTPPPTAPTTAIAAPSATPDVTAATDRSAARRPWLATGAAPETTAPRLGVVESAKPAPPPPPTPAPQAKPAETKTAAVMVPPAATAPVPPAAQPTSILAPPKTEAKTEPAKTEAKAEPAPVENDPTRDVAGIPALQAAGQAPGAPRRFDLPTGADVGPAVAGGRPRLVEPPLPPTDKVAVSAPPPRYANLTDVKHDASPAPAANAIKVAFVVGGLGLSQTATDAAINKLPPAVTLAFSPYARDLKKWIEKAKSKGHEVLIEVPMESKQFPAEDPGPLGLLTGLTPKENQDRLETILKEAASVAGVLDVMGSKFRESGEHINPVFAKLKQSNLFYVQGTPGVRVGEAGVPTAVADLVLDERPFRAAIDARLDYTERLAKYQGSAVASMSAKPVNFERMVLWIEQAQKKGVVLAPMSQVLIKQ